MNTIRGLCLVLLASCGGGDGPPGGGRPQGPRAVQTARPSPLVWQRTIELGGTLEAPERVEIAARIEGAVIDLGVDLGDRVERGQTLARITPDDFAARVAQTDAEAELARAERDRVARLNERDLASREQLEQAETRARVTSAQSRLARRQLRDTRVVAPFDGAIAARLVSPGAFVRVGTPLFVLVATSPLRLALDVPERFAGEVRAGTSVRLASEGRELAARIGRVAPVVDPATRTFRAQIEVPPDDGLLAGRYVRATIELGTIDDTVAVPRGAVFEVLGTSRVVEIVDGVAQPRDVELVAEDGARAIVRGLDPSSEIVSRSPGLIAPGTEVRVASDEAPPARAGTPRQGGRT